MQVPLSDVVPEVNRAVKEIQELIHKHAKETIFANIHMYNGTVEDKEGMEELRRTAEHNIVSLFLCEDERCGADLEQRIGVSVLGVPVNEKEEAGKCIICSMNARRVYVARAY